MEVRRRIDVSGIVQGVGFRPYIYRLATERHLRGSVSNTPAGVTIEIQGPSSLVEEFVYELPQQVPPLGRITELRVSDLPCNGDREFRIVTSHRGSPVHTLISPDVAVCEDCLREMFSPTDRRYRYPFINCTNCGPRFTIVRDIPYDRPRTSMAQFTMCAACQAEYDDPLNRRFHAQPNACWDCGPRLEFWSRDGNRVQVDDPIASAIAALRAGQVVAVKGLGGFHLSVDATNEAAVRLLRERKKRIEKPFAIMVPNIEGARELCELDEAGSQVMLSMQRPIVLLPRKLPSVIAEQVAPCNRELGVFLPYTPLHHLLFAQGEFTALVMTSGNLSEEPIAISNDEALARLSGLADFFLLHDRDILLRCDDSVVRMVSGRPRQLRRSRAYVPVPVFVHKELPHILAVGGELKNTISVSDGDRVFLSQHIGDLENLESYKFFEEAVDHLEKILEIEPAIVAYDLHPDYFSTKWALKQRNVSLVGVQHHHAHIASCMAEHHLDGAVIGFALDGTGFGTDGHIWGGEVLIADYAKFERAAHLEYVRMPGGSAAIREPWRMAISYLYHHFGESFRDFKLPFLSNIDPQNVDVVLRMTQRAVNSPLTSSCGRLFDAVAALAGVRQEVNYEAQAAIELQAAISGSDSEDAYSLDLAPGADGLNILSKPLFEELICDLRSGVSISSISRRFHNGLVEIFMKTAKTLRTRSDLNRVCLSGGTFNNVYLLTRFQSKLDAAGFDVFTHSEVPAGDGGLCLGQTLVAAHRIEG